MKNFTVSGFAAAAALFPSIKAQSCDELTTEDYLDDSGAKKIEYDTVQGFYRDMPAWYWEFGPRSSPNAGPGDNPADAVLVAPLYLPERADGTAAGRPIIDVLPCQPNYSDLWRINRVIISDDIEADSLTSKAMIDEAIAAGTAEIQETEERINCPIVPIGSTIQDSGPVADVPLPADMDLWYQDQPVFCFDFGTVETDDTAPIFTPVNESGEVVGPNIIDVKPGEDGYTPFWSLINVTVPDDVEDVELTSFERVEDSELDMKVEGIVVNCPVAAIGSEELVEGAVDGDGSGADGVMTGIMTSSVALIGALLV